MSGTPLSIETEKYLQLRERIALAYPEADEETLLDTLEGITDLHEMIAAVIRSALVDEALQAGLRGRLDDMKERLSRLEVRASKKRELALRGHDRGGAHQARAARLYRLNPRRVPCPRGHRRETIPEAYWLPQPPKLDRQRSARRAQARHRRSLGLSSATPNRCLA